MKSFESPSEVAGNALVSRIAMGNAYCLDYVPEFTRVQIDPLEQITGLKVDVVDVSQKRPTETLDFSDNTSIKFKVWIRSQLDPSDIEFQTSQLMLLRQQIFDQLDNWDSPGRRVQVWECDAEEQTNPLKTMLIQANLFVATISLRVEVRDDCDD